MISRVLPVLAFVLTAIFFGIAFYISVAEQPARLALANTPLLEQWKISFGIGIALQGSLTIAAGLAGFATWWIRRDMRWLFAGLLMLCNWPWTLFFISPINETLLAIPADAAGPASRALIEHWGIVHVGRTVISFVALLLFFSALYGSIVPIKNARLPS